MWVENLIDTSMDRRNAQLWQQGTKSIKIGNSRHSGSRAVIRQPVSCVGRGLSACVRACNRGSSSSAQQHTPVDLLQDGP